MRVFNLLDLDRVFVDLISHPVALEIAGHMLNDDVIVSNFTANIAKPGSESMVIHSDLGIVLPEPWHAPWSLNVIWCLDDVRGENGGTLFMPGSHHYQRRADVPADIAQQMVPFEAKAGSVVAMDGRLWHTSVRIEPGTKSALCCSGNAAVHSFGPNGTSMWNFPKLSNKACRPICTGGWVWSS